MIIKQKPAFMQALEVQIFSVVDFSVDELLVPKKNINTMKITNAAINVDAIARDFFNLSAYFAVTKLSLVT